jgi:hypothetical protein
MQENQRALVICVCLQIRKCDPKPNSSSRNLRSRLTRYDGLSPGVARPITLSWDDDRNRRRRTCRLLAGFRYGSAASSSIAQARHVNEHATPGRHRQAGTSWQPSKVFAKLHSINNAPMKLNSSRGFPEWSGDRRARPENWRSLLVADFWFLAGGLGAAAAAPGSDSGCANVQRSFVASK